jgi:thiol:disulfide interchange protein
MEQTRRVRLRRYLAAAAIVLGLTATVGAQVELPSLFDAGRPVQSKASAEVSAALTADPLKPGEAVLAITIKVPDGASTYGQDKTAQKKTAIKITESQSAEELGEGFLPDREPTIEFEEILGKEVGKYKGQVTFSRRFRVEPGASIKGQIDFLLCDDSACIPIKKPFSATLTELAAGADVAAAVEPQQQADAPPSPVTTEDPLKWGYRIVPTRRIGGKETTDPVRVQFVLSPRTAATGEKVTLSITMDLDENWHTYSLRPGQGQIELPTEISLTQIEGLNPDGEWREAPPAEARESATGTSHSLSHRVTWSKDFKRTESPTLKIAGELTYQICETDSQCKPPKNLPFALGDDQPSELVKDAVAAIAISEEPPAEAVTYEVAATGESTSLATALLFAFIGGLTLNIMPCVLPVLAIKILSFVQQAGESRSRILALNLAYTLGVVSVFWLLAALAAFASYSWGGLFQQEWFRVGMVLLLFVLGLNMLGVFEVVLPGLVNQAAGRGHREGLPGAFLTGIFATLLATPCSTAYMGYAFAWSLKQQVPIIFLVWTVMGLGMALPYLLIGMFPSLIRLLPRPGMWMVRFKQLSAFALFAAAVFFLASVDQRNVLAVLYAAVGLALGLWMIGNLYDLETSFAKKSIVRILALLIGGGICFYAWQTHRVATMPVAHKLDWKKFESAAFEQLRKEGRPVLIDFTADWCLICKQNEATALNTKATATFLRDNGIVAMVADWTDENDEIRTWLNRFGRDQVPFYVIAPPDPKAKLITMEGLISQEAVLEKLEQAMSGSPVKGQVEAEPAVGRPSRANVAAAVAE